MAPAALIARRRASESEDRSGSQKRVIDLRRLLGEPAPAEADPSGERYCCEREAHKGAGAHGWADVWKRHCFAWEYKGKHADLDAAFDQLRRYALALENPPLLVVCDMARFRIRTRRDRNRPSVVASGAPPPNSRRQNRRNSRSRCRRRDDWMSESPYRTPSNGPRDSVGSGELGQTRPRRIDRRQQPLDLRPVQKRLRIVERAKRRTIQLRSRYEQRRLRPKRLLHEPTGP